MELSEPFFFCFSLNKENMNYSVQLHRVTLVELENSWLQIVGYNSVFSSL